MRSIYLFFFSLLTCSSFGQISCEGVVLSNFDSVIIPFTSIQIGNTGTTSNARGCYSFYIPKDIKLSSKVVLSCLGYEKKELMLSDFITQDSIFLQRKIYEIPEIEVIEGRFSSIEIGFNNLSPIQSSKGWVGMKFALFIPNKKNLKGYIESIHYYISCRGNPNIPFRARVMSIDTLTGAPEKDLVMHDVIVRADKCNDYVTVDLSMYNIPFPRNGFFIVAEHLSNGDPEELIRKGGIYQEHNNIRFGATFRKSKKINYTWKEYYGNWTHSKNNELNNTIVSNIAFYATIKVLKRNFLGIF